MLIKLGIISLHWARLGEEEEEAAARTLWHLCGSLAKWKSPIFSPILSFSAQGFKCGADWTRVTYRWVSCSTGWLPANRSILPCYHAVNSQIAHCVFVWLQSWRLLCGWRLSRWSPVHLECPDRKSGQNSGQKSQVRYQLCASLLYAWKMISGQTECGDLNFEFPSFSFLFLQLSHQLRVLVSIRNICRQCGERLQGHPLVRHLTQSLKARSGGDVAGGL